jgi:hypothetical protein
MAVKTSAMTGVTISVRIMMIHVRQPSAVMGAVSVAVMGVVLMAVMVS